MADVTFAWLYTCKKLTSFPINHKLETRIAEQYTNQQLKVHLKVPSKCLYVPSRPDGGAQ